MVFGLFEGNKIEVKCEKGRYKRGETINCECILKLKKPIEARGIKAEFFRLYGQEAEPLLVETQEKTETRIYGSGEKFNFTFELGEKAFPAQKQPEGVVGAIMAAANERMKTVGWSINVSLDVEGKADATGFIHLDTDPPAGAIY